MIELKSADELRLMRRAGLVVAEGLDAMVAAATVGVTTAEVDAVGREVLARHGAESSFLGYGDYGTPFPGVACISTNNELVHGIPGDRVLQDGDVVSIDFGAIVEGWHGDAARTIIVGSGTAEDEALIDATREAFWAGARAMRDGGRVGDVSKAIEGYVKSLPTHYGTLREYTGHGIGSEMHMDPDVPNWHRRRPTPRLSVGMALAIEPMLTTGTHQTLELDDDWTVVSRDGSNGSHWENTVALTEHGIWVLTEHDGGASRLGDLFGPLSD
ncbi:type I methionyl aminopeptidase [Tessaracoccus sp. MC1865]|uniref:type I methionyl aminopeptidase n=1 Tax=unclassified Tessaracoccus TaxID=2635419 RepID=UPI0016017164|nr:MULTISPECIES: type I methionyl aminopeptidase [unclassified Tessaracoccus]MBB1483726.1 type I methionyl aminopeptidase [Tessaracoccus sp. MC1865]MBB1508763.1 type I methionyl aminopeptidase [Tessaracoccus sp. MC1756]QTO36795.1 type I methionyl aminopeptidase [Tessaracoccus sp. MC1865]